MLGEIRISVVIPCYNAALYLEQTLRSVVAQTYAAHEVIVVDDGSTDESARIAESFAPLVRVIRQTNHGESTARNRGIAESRGDWVALLDADDIWEPEKLQCQVDVVRQQPTDLVCVYNDFYRFRDDVRVPEELRADIPKGADARISLLFDWCIQPSTAMIRRDVLERVRFPESVHHGEDPIFFALLLDEGRFVRINKLLTGYRLSTTQQSMNKAHFDLKRNSLIHWFRQNVHRYSAAEQERFQARFLPELIEMHDKAYWERNFELVRECRTLYAALCGPSVLPPPLFRKPLFPAWIVSVKDWMDQLVRR
jgi:glycosyltransferase involved in cell wall biosynthesis